MTISASPREAINDSQTSSDPSHQWRLHDYSLSFSFCLSFFLLGAAELVGKNEGVTDGIDEGETENVGACDRVGRKLGTTLGELLVVGRKLGLEVGSWLGFELGIELGVALGFELGTELGVALGIDVGFGDTEGLAEEVIDGGGDNVGDTDGKEVGLSEGTGDGIVDGIAVNVGLAEGALLIPLLPALAKKSLSL